MTGITQNKQKALFSLWPLTVGRNVIVSSEKKEIVIVILMIVTKLIIIVIIIMILLLVIIIIIIINNNNINNNNDNVNKNQVIRLKKCFLRLCLKVLSYRLSLMTLGFDSKTKDQ